MKSSLATFALSCVPLALAAEGGDYKTTVLPIMKKHCWDCHSSETEVKGNLALDPETLFDQIGKFNIIRPGDSAESGFVERLKLDETHNDFMPRKGKTLPRREIEAIEKWIDAGAIVDAENPTEEEQKRLAEAKPASPGSASSVGGMATSPGFHTWTNREGKAIEARLLGIENDAAKLLARNGRSYLVPLANLDEASVEQAKRLSAGE